MARKISTITRRTSRNLNRAIKMVAGRKLIISKETLALIDVAVTDIGNPNGKTLEFYIEEETKELLIFIREDGYPVTGKRDNPEIYCAEVCREILELLRCSLTGAGTVKFPAITVDTIEDLDAKCLVVNLNEYRANPGVLEATTVQNGDDTESAGE